MLQFFQWLKTWISEILSSLFVTMKFARHILNRLRYSLALLKLEVQINTALFIDSPAAYCSMGHILLNDRLTSKLLCFVLLFAIGPRILMLMFFWKCVNFLLFRLKPVHGYVWKLLASRQNPYVVFIPSSLLCTTVHVQLFWPEEGLVQDLIYNYLWNTYWPKVHEHSLVSIFGALK